MNERYTLLNGDSLEVLKTLPDNSIDSIVTDPPYGLSEEPKIEEVLQAWLTTGTYKPQSKAGGFMGQAWDSFVPGPDIYRECYRVLKPGGYLLAFSGSRTLDLTTIAIRLASFEIRDSFSYLKDTNEDLFSLLNSFDDPQREAFLRLLNSQEGGIGNWAYSTGKPKGADVSLLFDKSNKVLSERPIRGWRSVSKTKDNSAHSWGYNSMKEGDTLLPITGPVSQEAKEWEGWFTSLKPTYEPIVMARKPLQSSTLENIRLHKTGALNIGATRIPSVPEEIQKSRSSLLRSLRKRPGGYDGPEDFEVDLTKGRFTTNFILDSYMPMLPSDTPPFYYAPKVTKQDRDEGVKTATGVNHPTVKPTSLMRYLVRLVTPAGGLVVDPFMGSGSTGKACMWEGMQFIGIDLSPDYVALADERINFALENPAPPDSRLDYHLKSQSLRAGSPDPNTEQESKPELGLLDIFFDAYNT